MVVVSRQAGCTVCGFDGDGGAIGGYFFDLYACLEIVGSLATCKKFCSDAPASFSNAAGSEVQLYSQSVRGFEERTCVFVLVVRRRGPRSSSRPTQGTPTRPPLHRPLGFVLKREKRKQLLPFELRVCCT